MDYPTEIESILQEVAELDWELVLAKQELLNIEHQVDIEISYNSSYKNEHQRKLALTGSLFSHSNHGLFLLKVAKLNKTKAVKLAGLEKLRGEFALVKLELQLEISRAREAS